MDDEYAQHLDARPPLHHRHGARYLMEKTVAIGKVHVGERLDKRIPVGTLVPGMFVSRLDRPWTSTPFLMQGFLIRGDREIELLRQYCQFVYVDPQEPTDR